MLTFYPSPLIHFFLKNTLLSSLLHSIYSSYLEMTIHNKMKFTTIVLFLSLCSLTISEVRRKYKLPYCTNESIGIFKLSDPRRCTIGANSTKQIRPIKVYKPFNRDVNMTAIACRKKIDLYNCILYSSSGVNNAR